MRALQLVDDRKLEKVDLPEPDAPGPGEVTLRVKAVALNHIDVWGWRGMAFAKRKMPLTIGRKPPAWSRPLAPAFRMCCRASSFRSMARAPAGSASPAVKAVTICANMSRAYTVSISTVSRRKDQYSRPPARAGPARH